MAQHNRHSKSNHKRHILIIITMAVTQLIHSYPTDAANSPQSHSAKRRNRAGESFILPAARSSSEPRASERAAAAEEEAAHHGDEGDGLDGRDDAPERGVHQQRHVPHHLGPPPRRRRAELLGARPLPPLLYPEPEVRGRRGEQRRQAGQAQVRRPPEHGHQASPHGAAGGGGGSTRWLVLPPPLPSRSLSVSVPSARCVGVGWPR